MMSWGGDNLRAARQEKGYSVEDIAQRLKIPARYVTALEAEDPSGLPEATFVRGYIRAYARLVGLDPEPMLSAFAPVEVKAPKPLVGIEGATMPKARRSSRGGSRPVLGLRRHHYIAGAVVLVVALLASTWLSREADVPSPAKVAPVAAPVAAPTSAPEQVPAADQNALTREVPLPGVPAPAAQLPPTAPVPGAPATTAPAATPSANTGPAPAATAVPPAPAAASQPATSGAAATKPPARGLFLHFHSAAWVEVRDSANLVIHSSFATADSMLALEGKAPLTVTLGDAAAADIWWNGERVPADRYARTGVARIVVGKAAAR